MAVQLDNRISYVDIFVMLSVVFAGIVFIFSYGSAIEANSQEIEHLKGDVTRIEVTGKQRDEEILDQLKENKTYIDKLGEASERGRMRIEDKLDKIIDRELDKNHAPKQ